MYCEDEYRSGICEEASRIGEVNGFCSVDSDDEGMESVERVRLHPP